MAPQSTAVAATSSSPYQLQNDQVLRSTRAVIKHLSSSSPSKKDGKAQLLDDEAHDIRLEITTKKHMAGKEKDLKPRKLYIPHPYNSLSNEELKVCLITADPQDTYDAIVKDARFPAHVRSHLVNPADETGDKNVIGVKSLDRHYKKAPERRRQLAQECQVFLADDRIITRLAGILGKDFYESARTRPVPINLQGKKEARAGKPKLSEGGEKAKRAELDPESVGRIIERAVGCTTFPVVAGVNASVVVGRSDMDPEQIAANIEFVVNEVVERFVTKGWKGIKSLDVKGTHTAALPIWKTSELWEAEDDVLDHEPVKAIKETKQERRKRKRSTLTEATDLKEQDKEQHDASAADNKKKQKTEAVAAKAAKKAQKEELLKKSKAAVADA